MRRALLVVSICIALSQSRVRADQRSRSGRHRQEHRDRRREGVAAQHRTAAAQPAATDGSALEPLHQPCEVRRAGSASLAHARRRLSLHTGLQRSADFWRSCGRRLSGGESSGRGCPGSPGAAHPGRSPRDDLAARDTEHDRCRRDRGDERYGPASLQRTEARTARHRCPGGARHRSVERTERDGRARQDQRRGAHRRAAATGARPAPGRRGRAAARSTRSVPGTPTPPR